MKKDTLPRGFRNCNPLNIRIGNVWLGEVSTPTDPDFEQFVHMKYGVRAAFVLLRRYIRHYHRDNVTAIVSAWAPASENNTQRYIDIVCAHAKLDPVQVIDYADADVMERLFQGMCLVENGRTLPRDVVLKGYQMA